MVVQETGDLNTAKVQQEDLNIGQVHVEADLVLVIVQQGKDLNIGQVQLENLKTGQAHVGNLNTGQVQADLHPAVDQEREYLNTQKAQKATRV